VKIEEILEKNNIFDEETVVSEINEAKNKSDSDKKIETSTVDDDVKSDGLRKIKRKAAVAPKQFIKEIVKELRKSDMLSINEKTHGWDYKAC
jgi:hypothetical protein